MYERDRLIQIFEGRVRQIYVGVHVRNKKEMNRRILCVGER